MFWPWLSWFRLHVIQTRTTVLPATVNTDISIIKNSFCDQKNMHDIENQLKSTRESLIEICTSVIKQRKKLFNLEASSLH